MKVKQLCQRLRREWGRRREGGRWGEGVVAEL